MPLFDRIPSKPDPKRRTRYSMTPLVEGLKPRSYSWGVPFILDQGSEGACVAHGITHEAVARPVPVDFTRHVLPIWANRATRSKHAGGSAQEVAQAFAFDLYDWARNHDEWPGMNYDGTSADAGAKGAVDAKLWGEYRWAQTVDEFAVWVSRNGPGDFAVDWFSNMMRPDANGYLNPTGTLEGGHLICANGFSVRRDAFLLPNSWSDRWGNKGYAWLHREDAAYLASRNGEMLGPIRRLK